MRQVPADGCAREGLPAFLPFLCCCCSRREMLGLAALISCRRTTSSQTLSGSRAIASGPRLQTCLSSHLCKNDAKGERSRDGKTTPASHAMSEGGT